MTEKYMSRVEAILHSETTIPQSRVESLLIEFINKSMTEDEVNGIITDYLTNHPVSPQTIVETVESYLEDNPIDVSSLVLTSIDDGNGNVVLQVNTN